MSTYTQLQSELNKRIMILDGAMGTMIQKYKFTEEDYRGQRFATYEHSLKGNNDLLSLTQPEVIKNIHLEFLKAGADIIETNTFNANEFSMADYHMEDLVAEINIESVKLAKQAIAEMEAIDPSKKRYVAGAIGPTNRTASLSPDVNNPGYRAVTFDDLYRSYREQALALIGAGADILLIETVFDTLNCKAALYAVNEIKDEQGIDIPVMVSGTITDNSGRTLSGQTAEAFWISISHGNLLSVGLNCALGAEQMAPHIKAIQQVADVYVSCYPNAGLPNEFGEYDHSPEHMAGILNEWCKDGMVNIVGGCCGTTPEHIAAIAQVAAIHKPRVLSPQTV